MNEKKTSYLQEAKELLDSFSNKTFSTEERCSNSIKLSEIIYSYINQNNSFINFFNFKLDPSNLLDSKAFLQDSIDQLLRSKSEERTLEHFSHLLKIYSNINRALRWKIPTMVSPNTN